MNDVASLFSKEGFRSWEYILFWERSGKAACNQGKKFLGKRSQDNGKCQKILLCYESPDKP